MSAERFAAWYRIALAEIGMPVAPEDRGSDSGLAAVPTALRGWYVVAGNSWLNRAHNRILPPDRLHPLDGKIVFAEENQDVVIWAYDADAGIADPLVWQGQPAADSGAVREWYSEELPISRFIVQMLVHTVASEAREP